MRFGGGRGVGVSLQNLYYNYVDKVESAKYLSAVGTFASTIYMHVI